MSIYNLFYPATVVLHIQFRCMVYSLLASIYDISPGYAVIILHLSLINSLHKLTLIYVSSLLTNFIIVFKLWPVDNSP